MRAARLNQCNWLDHLKFSIIPLTEIISGVFGIMIAIIINSIINGSLDAG